jgi:translation machinery-associated protein 16
MFASYVHQFDQELEEAKKARRPGRPASTKEDLLMMKVTALKKEQEDGFCEDPITYCLGYS